MPSCPNGNATHLRCVTSSAPMAHSIPAILLSQLAADLRPEGDGYKNAKLKLIAGLLGVPYNTLRQREVAAARRRLNDRAGRGRAVLAHSGFRRYRRVASYDPLRHIGGPTNSRHTRRQTRDDARPLWLAGDDRGRDCQRQEITCSIAQQVLGRSHPSARDHIHPRRRHVQRAHARGALLELPPVPRASASSRHPISGTSSSTIPRFLSTRRWTLSSIFFSGTHFRISKSGAASACCTRPALLSIRSYFQTPDVRCQPSLSYYYVKSKAASL